MTVIVDEALWWWRGRRWAHLCSDRDLAELHDFARTLGLAHLSFGGDHYDITETQRRVALELGAQPVRSRQLLARLKAAGLRRPAGSGSHRWCQLAGATWPADGSARLGALTGWSPPEPTRRFLDSVAARWAEGHPFEVRVLQRRGELALVLSEPAELAEPRWAHDGVFPIPPAPVSITRWWFSGRPRMLELFIAIGDLPTMTSSDPGLS